MAGFQASAEDVEVTDELLTSLLKERAKREAAASTAKAELQATEKAIRQRLARMAETGKRYVAKDKGHIYTAQLNEVEKLDVKAFDLEPADDPPKSTATRARKGRKVAKRPPTPQEALDQIPPRKRAEKRKGGAKDALED